MVFAEYGRKIKLIPITEDGSDLFDGTLPNTEHLFRKHHSIFYHVRQRSAIAILQEHPVYGGTACAACFGQIRNGIHLVKIEMNDIQKILHHIKYYINVKNVKQLQFIRY